MSNIPEILKLANQLYREKKFKDAIDGFLFLANTERKNGHLKEASICYNMLASCYENLGQIDDAIENYQQAIQLGEQLNDVNANGVRYNNIGKLFEIKGYISKAVEFYNKAIGLDKILGNPKENIIHLNNLASAYQKQGKLDETIQIFTELLQRDELNGDSQEKSTIINNLGTVFQERGYLDKALKKFEEALEIDDRMGNEHSKAIRLSNIGIIHKDFGHYEKALKYFIQSLEIHENLNSLQNIAISCNNISTIFTINGEFSKAQAFLLRSFEINKKIGNIRSLGTDFRNLGGLAKAQKNVYKAFQYYAAALDIAHKQNDLRNKSFTLYLLGNLYQEQNDLDSAIKYLKKALSLNQKQVDGKEIDYKKGEIQCPNPDCQSTIEIKVIGRQGAVVHLCQQCHLQFSLWMVENPNSKYYIRVLSDHLLGIESPLSGSISFESYRGQSTKETITEWLYQGALISYCLGQSHILKKDFKEGYENLHQSSTKYRALGLVERSNEIISLLEILIKILSPENAPFYTHQVDFLKRQNAEMLRSRNLSHLSVQCPMCQHPHKIRVDTSIIAIEYCKYCTSKFSVFFDQDAEEFFVNLIESPEKIFKREPMEDSLDKVKYCMACGLYIGDIVHSCPRCGFHIVRADIFG